MARRPISFRMARAVMGLWIAAWIAAMAPVSVMAEDGEATFRGRQSQRRIAPGGGLQRSGESDGTESRLGKTSRPSGAEAEKSSSPKGGATLASCCAHASCGANSGGACGCGSKCPGKPVTTSAPSSPSSTKSKPMQNQSPGPKEALKSPTCGSDCNCCAGGAVFNQEGLTLRVEQLQPADAAALMEENAFSGEVIEVGDTGGAEGTTAGGNKAYTYDQREEKKKLLKSKRKELADFREYTEKHGETKQDTLKGSQLAEEIKDLEKEVGKLEPPGTLDEEKQKLESAKKQAEAAKQSLADQQAKVDGAKGKLDEAEKKLAKSTKPGAQSLQDMENKTNAEKDLKKAKKELGKANTKLDLKEKEFKQLEKEVADREQQIKNMEKAAAK